LPEHSDVTAARFHEAVERGDVDGSRDLLTRRPDIVDIGRGEMRALHMAVLRRDLAMTRLLLEYNADTETGIWPKRDATSPYVLARDRGLDEIVAVLDAARRERGARMPSGPTEATRKLERAWDSGSEEAIVSVFGEHPELKDICPPNGLTMLHQAAGSGAVRVVEWLLAHDASNVNRRSEQGWTPLEFAATGRMGPWLFDNATFARVAALLLDHRAELGPLSAAALGRWEYFAGRTKEDLAAKGVLEAAVKGNQPDILRQLLDFGLDPDERTPVGRISDQTWSAGGPLFQAVILNRLDMARLLLARGADPNAGVWTSGSPAFRAYEGRDPEMIALIEQHGGWIDPGSAGYARQTEIARRMLAGEIDPHLTPDDFSGGTVAEQLLCRADRLGTRRPAMVLDVVAADSGTRGLRCATAARRRRVLRANPRTLRPAPSRLGLRTDDAARSDLARSQGRRAARDDAARRRRAPRRARYLVDEHAARLGVPVGARRAGQAAAGPRRRSE
jgi:ankyrin repeat protein